jgi:hypothetical protein
MSEQIEIVRLNNEIRRLEAEIERLKTLLKLKDINSDVVDFNKLIRD